MMSKQNRAPCISLPSRGHHLFRLFTKTEIQAETIDFDNQIAPILVEHCLECHQGANRSRPETAELRFLKQGGENGRRCFREIRTAVYCGSE